MDKAKLKEFGRTAGGIGVLLFLIYMGADGCKYVLNPALRGVGSAYEYFRYPSRNVRIAEELEVNLSKKERVVVKKNEKKGLLDMINLSKAHLFEEQYAYLPEKTTWIETGIDEEYMPSEDVGARVTGDKRLMTKLMKENNEIHSYHIHPYKIAKELRERAAKLADVLSGENQEVNDRIKTIYQLESSIMENLPSSTDLENMISESVIFYKVNPAGRFMGGVVSAPGVFTYSLSEEGKRHFENISDEKIRKYVQEKDEKVNEELFRSDFLIGYDFKNRLSMMAEMLSDKYMNVNFKFFEEFK